MKKITLFAAMLLATLTASAQYGSGTEGTDQWNFTSDAQGWVKANTSTALGVSGGAVQLVTTDGGSSKLRLTADVTALKSKSYVHIFLNSLGSGHDKLNLTFTYDASLTKTAAASGLLSDGSAQTVDIRLDNKTEWTNATSISQLDFAPQNTGTSKSNGSTMNVDAIVFDDNASVNAVKSNVIAGAVVTSANGSITVTGASLVAVYNVAGQQVAAEGLASGVYIVKIAKAGKTASVKVVL